MVSKPKVTLNGSLEDVLGATEITRVSEGGAVNVTGKKRRKLIRRRQMQHIRLNLMRQTRLYLQALESVHSSSERELLAESVLGLLKGTLEAHLKEPRNAQPLEDLLPQSLPPNTTQAQPGQSQTPANFSDRSASPLPLQQNVRHVMAKTERVCEIEPPLALEYPQSKVLESCPALIQDDDGFLTSECAERLRYFHPEVVLYAPQIPPNTGTVARLCAALSAKLHLIEPLGFELSEKTVRRAGLDYWEHVDITVHKDWAHFQSTRPGRRFILVETGGTLGPAEFAFAPGDILVFGSETTGIPKPVLSELLNSGHAHLVTIPMFNRGVRSLNLANSVSIVLHDAIAYLHGKGQG